MYSAQFNLTGTNVIQQYTGSGFLFNTATFFGYKGFVNATGINNSGSLNFGVSSVNLPISLLQGDSVTFQLPQGFKESINNFYFRGTSGDGAFLFAY